MEEFEVTNNLNTGLIEKYKRQHLSLMHFNFQDLIEKQSRTEIITQIAVDCACYLGDVCVSVFKTLGSDASNVLEVSYTSNFAHTQAVVSDAFNMQNSLKVPIMAGDQAFGYILVEQSHGIHSWELPELCYIAAVAEFISIINDKYATEMDTELTMPVLPISHAIN